MTSDWIFRNANLVLPDRVADGADLLVRHGRIAGIGSALGAAVQATEVDASELHLIPGIIDLHTDTLEKEICPRPGADFPLDVALQELDRKLVACGVTTVYHSLHFGYREAEFSQRSRYAREELIRAAKAYNSQGSLARSRMHLRFETAGSDVSDAVRTLLDEGLVDFLSFMDHTPGQGQYQADRWIANRVRDGSTEEEARVALVKRQARTKVPMEKLRALSARATQLGIVVASHDDCSEEKVRAMHGIGVTVSEFPVNLEATRAAKALGMQTLCGATNSLRGGSLSENLDVNAALAEGLVDGLCSDYYPPSILHAMVKLWKSGARSLPSAINLGTLAPARVLGQEHELGSLQAGRLADVVLLDLRSPTAKVLATLVGGRCVSQATDLRSRIGYRAVDKTVELQVA